RSRREAFASGLPVVATRTGGVPAMLTDGVHGLLVPDNDDAALASQGERLIEDPVWAHPLAAARHTCAAYEWPVVAGQWLAVYQLLARRTPAPGQELSRCTAQGLPERVAAAAEPLSPSEPA